MTMMSKGTTLLELIIVLAILTILSWISVPVFSDYLNQYRLKTAILTLENDLRFAKNYANHKRVRVSLCISQNHVTCIQESSQQWQQGWIIFIDDNNNFEPKAQNILRYQTALHSSVQILSNINIQHGIQFNAGRKLGKTLGTGLANGHFMICTPKQNAHKIIINIYGRIRKELLGIC